MATPITSRRNCGVEGPTDDPPSSDLRYRQAAQSSRHAVPLTGYADALAGDKVCPYQGGTTMPACQDSEIGWIDWRCE